jgi:hypothetical protein
MIINHCMVPIRASMADQHVDYGHGRQELQANDIN